MLMTFFKRDTQIFMAGWRQQFPSWLFFFLILFTMGLKEINQSSVFFLLFFVLILTVKDTFLSDQKLGLIPMLVSEKKGVGAYVCSKTLSNIIFVLMPLLIMITIFTHNFDLILPGMLMTILGTMAATMQIKNQVSWLLHLLVLPFMIPIFLVLNMASMNMISYENMIYIFSGMLLIYGPLSIFFGTVCLKLGD